MREGGRMKINALSFEPMECDALRKLMEHIVADPGTAAAWEIPANVIEGCQTFGAPLVGTQYSPDSHKNHLDTIYALAVQTDDEDHAHAGLSEVESTAVWNVYRGLRPILRPEMEA